MTRDSKGRAIAATAHYTYRMEQGPVLLERAEAATQVVSGKTLLDLAADDFADPRSRLESKQLMRTLMAYYLSGRELETRKIFRELQDL